MTRGNMGLMDTIKGWFGSAKDVAGDAVDKAQDMAGDAMEKAGDAAEKAKDMAGDAVDKVQDMMPGGDHDAAEEKSE